MAFAVSLAPSADAVASLLVVDVDRDDATSGGTARRTGDDERADPAGADHRKVVVRPLRNSGEGVERDRERLRHGRRVVAARVGHDVADRGRRGYVLGQSAVHLKPERAVLGAQVGAAAQAPGAVTA